MVDCYLDTDRKRPQKQQKHRIKKALVSEPNPHAAQDG